MRQCALQRLERLHDDADRRLEGVGILLGRPANCLRSLAQGADHAVEIFRDVLEFRDTVEAGKGQAAGSSGADSAGLPLETAEITPIDRKSTRLNSRH